MRTCFWACLITFLTVLTLWGTGSWQRGRGESSSRWSSRRTVFFSGQQQRAGSNIVFSNLGGYATDSFFHHHQVSPPFVIQLGRSATPVSTVKSELPAMHCLIASSLSATPIIPQCRALPRLLGSLHSCPSCKPNVSSL